MNDRLELSKTLHLYWVSGSGNTLCAAEAFAMRLRELGWTVELKPLERSDPARIDPMVTFGIAFPTHCFSIPEIIRNFVRGLPNVEGTPAMLLGTHGAFSGGILGPLKRLLSRKGFRCVGGRILRMPDSFFPFGSTESHRRLFEKALERARRYAAEFDAGTVRWSRWPILSDLWDAAFGAFFASRKWFGSWGTTVHARASQCTRCGTCVRACPVAALEQPSPEEPPRANRRCTNCLRCVAVCPADAMRHMIGFRPYRCEPPQQLRERFGKEEG